MIDQNRPNLNEKEKIRTPGQEIPGQTVEPKKETIPVPERREEEMISEKLRKEIDLMEMNEDTKEEAQKKAKKIEFLGQKEKIEHLLKIAREKGVVFAIGVARKMNDPYLLDIFHDLLAKEGYFNDFSK
jgi:hypothetical protein